MNTTQPPAALHIFEHGPTLTAAEALVKVKAEPGAYTLEEAHDAWCPFWRAQRDADCTCEPTYRLWRLKGGPR